MAFSFVPMQPTHLQQKHFWQAVGAGAALHFVAVLAFLLWPKDDVLEIPVRTLDITLGDVDISASVSSPAPKVSVPKPAPAPKVEAPKPAPKPSPAPRPVAKAPSKSLSFLPAPAKPAPKPAPAKKVSIKTNTSPQSIPVGSGLRAKPVTPPAPKATPKPAPKVAAKPKPLPAPPVAKTVPIIPQVSQYVRAEAAPVQSITMSDSGASEKEIRARYTQQISSWLQSHQVVPQMAKQLGQHGTPMLRVRIDRAGAVKYFAIDKSSGYQLIDEAAMDMVRRANPFPTPPANFPGGQLLEFLIPLTFNLK